MPNPKEIQVTMSLSDFYHYQAMERTAMDYIEMFKRAQDSDGKAVMTDELRTTIEQIYL